MKPDGMGPFQPVNSHRVRPSFGGSRQHDTAERDRLEAEVQKRFATLAPARNAAEKLSRVERAMRRNAPDLAGGTAEEIAAVRARRRAHHYAKWPRPRLAALGAFAIMLMLDPLLGAEFAIWAVI